jgi:hypothetical protein
MKSKPTRGVLLFAFNNERMDYVRLASYCASRIRRHWRLPVTLITDEKEFTSDVSLHFDSVIQRGRTRYQTKRLYPDYGELLTFFNKDRVMADVLTPYDETIVIDTDYLVSTDTIPRLWDGQSLLIARHAHSLSNTEIPQYLKKLHTTTLPMYWATIICFDKSAPASKKFFQHWRAAIANYAYYAKLFKYEHELFRNDFAVTVAHHLLSEGVGTTEYDLPFSMPTAMPDIRVKGIEPLTLENAGRVYSDVHVMHKKSLLEQVCGLSGF